ncbi:MAG: M28 family peptidase, partial [Microvirga sp.]
ELAFVDQITLDEPWSLVEAFSTMHRWRPEDVNLAGREIAGRLEKLGIPYEMHQPEIFLSIPMGSSVEAGGATFKAKSPSSSLSVPGGLTGELVYLPANVKALRSYTKSVTELFGRKPEELADVTERIRGRILITEGFGNPALTQIVEEWGGIGVIAINPGVDIHWGTCTTVWGSPDLDDLPRRPTVPVVAVSKPVGQQLKAIAEAGGSVTIRTEMLEGWFPQSIPVTRIPGAIEPEKFVLLHGHYDSWEVGVGDNATGDATMLELARVFWANRDKLRRSIWIAWWPGHSTGRYAGSTWFADNYAIELDENCVAQVNCDSPGCRWATSYHHTTAMSETAGLVTSAIASASNGRIATMRPHRAGDYSFNNIGISSFYMLSSTMPDDLRAEKNYYDVSGCGGNIAWHTEHDTLEIADRDVLLTDMRIYLLSVLRVANAPVLPFDWRAVTDEFAATIAGYETSGRNMFDLALAKSACAGLATALDDLTAAAAHGSVPTRSLNDVSQRLARILVPINHTREARFRHDPAFTVPPLPTIAVVGELADIEPERRGFALVQATRGQNRLVAALRDAERLVRSVLSNSTALAAEG